jgi:DNA-binding transcriptional LysR family regulator
MLRAEELSGETMIARRSCEVLRETSGFFTSRGVRPRFSYRSSNDDRCMAFVRSGVGLTTAPKSHAGPGLVARRLDGYELCRRLGLITSPTGFVSNEVSELLSVAERTFAEHASSS